MLLISLFILSELLLLVLSHFPEHISLLEKTDEIVATFLNHQIKCSFHHSSTSVPLTNSERAAEQGLYDPPSSSEGGEAKKASFRALGAARSDESKHAN